MSNEHKLNWLAVVVLIVLVSMISYLAVLDWSRGSENGLECVYNCDSYPAMIESLK